MTTYSYRFYTVAMPDGEQYWLCGKSKKKVAAEWDVPIKNVEKGASFNNSHLREYSRKNQAGETF